MTLSCSKRTAERWFGAAQTIGSAALNRSKPHCYAIPTQGGLFRAASTCWRSAARLALSCCRASYSASSPAARCSCPAFRCGALRQLSKRNTVVVTAQHAAQNTPHSLWSAPHHCDGQLKGSMATAHYTSTAAAAVRAQQARACEITAAVATLCGWSAPARIPSSYGACYR